MTSSRVVAGVLYALAATFTVGCGTGNDADPTRTITPNNNLEAVADPSPTTADPAGIHGPTAVDTRPAHDRPLDDRPQAATDQPEDDPPTDPEDPEPGEPEPDPGVDPLPEPADEPAPADDPEPADEPEPVDDPQPDPGDEPEPEPEPADEPEPEPEPADEPQPEPSDEPPAVEPGNGWTGWPPQKPWPEVELPAYESILPQRPIELTSPDFGQEDMPYQPWTSGRSLAVHADEIFVAATEHDQVVVINRHTGAIKRIIEVGARPEQVVVGPDGTAYVTLRHASSVVSIAPDKSEVKEAAIVGVEPFGIALSPLGDTLFVSVSGEDRVVALEPGKLVKMYEWTVPNRPRGLAAKSSTDVVVAAQFGPAHQTYGKSTGTIELKLRTETPATTSLNLQAGTPTRALAVTLHPALGKPYVAHTLATPGDKMDVAFGKALGGGGGGYGGSKKKPGIPGPPELERAVRAAVTTFSWDAKITAGSLPVADPTTGEPMTDIIDQPTDVNHHPTWSLLFVVGQGTDNVVAFTSLAADPMRAPLAEIKVGKAPKAIAFSGDGVWAYVLNAHDFTISRIKLTPLLSMPQATTIPEGNVFNQAESGPLADYTDPIALTHGSVVKFGVDPLSSTLKLGRRTFTFARNNAITAKGEFACATCHFEGTEDKLTWVIPEGLRQTPMLASRVKGTGPFNWKGDEESLVDNMQNTIERMKGEGLSEPELEALAAFIESELQLPPNPHNDPEGLTVEQANGLLLFYDPMVGCGGCHVGGGTDGKNYNVGTLSDEEDLSNIFSFKKEITPDFNTPSLKGLWYSAPYLHDGSANTLEDVLNQTAGTMGYVLALSAEQKSDLIAYLLTL